MWTGVARWDIEDQTITQLSVAVRKLEEFHGLN
jgi:hypothetical protein